MTRYQKYRQPAQYIQQAQSGKPRSSETQLSAADLKFEFMLNALRLRQGFHTDLYTQRTGLAHATLSNELESAISLDLLNINNNHILPTDHGWLYLNEAIQLFLEE